MKLLALLTMLTLVGTLGTVSTVNAQNVTDTKCPNSGFGSDADFCGKVQNDNDRCGNEADFCYNGSEYVPNKDQGKDDNNNNGNDNDKGIYACNVKTDTDKFCKENLDRNYKRQQDQFHHTPGIAKITVGYGDVGSYYGKGKVVIKNEDTGQTLVVHKLNFAKQHHNQGPDCCVKVYKFDANKVDKGDTISAKVTGGGGSWESGPYNYTNNLRMSISLEEIDE